MRDSQKRVEDWMRQVPLQTVNAYPTILDLKTRILRARLMLEEVLETIEDGFGLDIFSGLQQCVSKEYIDTWCFEDRRRPDIVKIADGLADQAVVLLGTAVACGIDLEPIYDVVMDNNDLKLKTGTVDTQGKLVKAKDHPNPAPEIQKALDKQQLGLKPYEYRKY